MLRFIQTPVIFSNSSNINFANVDNLSEIFVALMTRVTSNVPLSDECLIIICRKSPVCFGSLYPEILNSGALFLMKSITLSQISGCIGQY